MCLGDYSSIRIGVNLKFIMCLYVFISFFVKKRTVCNLDSRLAMYLAYYFMVWSVIKYERNTVLYSLFTRQGKKNGEKIEENDYSKATTYIQIYILL